MGYSTYQNKAWKIMEQKVKQMKDDGDSRYEDFNKLMSESASEAFKKSTKTEDIADLLMDAINSSAFNSEAFAKQITRRNHRTLQQSFMRAIKECINEWDELHQEDWYDSRNESTVKVSSKLNEVLKNENFPLI